MHDCFCVFLNFIVLHRTVRLLPSRNAFVESKLRHKKVIKITQLHRLGKMTSTMQWKINSGMEKYLLPTHKDQK